MAAPLSHPYPAGPQWAAYPNFQWLILLSLLLPLLAQADPGGLHLRETVAPVSTENAFRYAGSYALLIGASNYRTDTNWAPLPTIPQDLTALADTLRNQHGFDVRTLPDPTQEDVEKAVKQFIRDVGFEEDARLVILVAGHSFTLGEEGYFAAVDTPNPDLSQRSAALGAISYSQFQTWAREIHSRHSLWLFDSCFGGMALGHRGNQSDNALLTSFQSPVTYFISAGGPDEQIPAGSQFTVALNNLLSGSVPDRIHHQYLTTHSMAGYLREQMAAQHNLNTHFGALKGNGDMLFYFPALESQTSSNPITPIQRFGRLNLDLYPKGAQVTFESIHADYTAGMVLEPGSYAMTVSAPGWESRRVTVDMPRNDYSPKISLTPNGFGLHPIRLDSIEDVARVLGPQVATQLSQTPQWGPMVIDGNYSVGNTLVADEIALYPGAQITFTDLSASAWIIKARKLRISGGSKGVSIGRTDNFAWPNLPQANPGRNALPANGYIRNGRDGANGNAGEQGAPGSQGARADLPPLYLLVEEVEWFGQTPGLTANDLGTLIHINLTGIDSQHSGQSGNGGNGSNGIRGLNSESKLSKCVWLAGRGGDGGNSGLPGLPADGVTGGAAGDLYLVGGPSLLESFETATIHQNGGKAGRPGTLGLQGQPGRRGGRGSREGWCQHEADEGRDGSQPAVPFPATGAPAHQGAAGRVNRLLLPEELSISRL